MNNAPSWLATYTPEKQRARVGANHLLRARRVLQLRQVRALACDGDAVQATVVTTAGEFPVSMTDREADCPCGHAPTCLHAAATLLAHLDLVSGSGKPRWLELIEQLLPEPELADAPAQPAATNTPPPQPITPSTTGKPLGIRLERARASWVALRIVEFIDDAWQPGEVSWQSLTRGFLVGYNVAHVQALRAFLAARANPQHQVLATLALTDLTAQVWPALHTAVSLGVHLEGTEGQPITLEDFPVTLSVERDGDFYLVGTTLGAATREATSSRTMLGNPIHGVLLEQADGWRAGGFTQPPDALSYNFLIHGRPIRVPVADSSQLMRVLPALRNYGEILLADDVDLPEPDEARLIVSFHKTKTPGKAARVSYSIDFGDHRPVEITDDLIMDRQTTERLLDMIPSHIHHTGVLDPAQYAELHDWLAHQTEIHYTLHNGLKPPTKVAQKPVIRLGLTDARDWFDLTVSVTIGDEDVPLKDLLTALDAQADAMMLPSGTWFTLDDAGLHELRTLLEEAKALKCGAWGELQLRPEHAGLWGELAALGVVERQSERWLEATSTLLGELPPPEVHVAVETTLRPYQVHGLEWLFYRWHTGLGGILADEMGLGKTLQALSVIAAIREQHHSPLPSLVIAPASVLSTWALEAQKFTPELRVSVLTDTAKRRGTSVADAIAGADLVVTSYTLLRLDADQYADLQFATVFLDEAQFAKNRQSITYKSVRRLHAHAKFAMTGTPLENNLMDVWSLLSITSPGLFPDPRRFDETYRRPVEGGDLDALQRLMRRIAPLMLRRTKSEVARELPPKQEQVLYVELGPRHRRIYDRRLTAIRRQVLGLVDDLGANRFAVFSSLTALRQLALSPHLVEESAHAESAKLDLLVDMVAEIVPEGHRALVFSSFTGFLKMAESRLQEAGFSSVYLDGSTRDRAERIRTFCQGNDPLFLISLKAGGFGLNLTEADYVFILDPWWNPAAESQAIDRTHRIGQDKHVFVYRLVSKDTIEDKVVALQKHKRELFNAVVADNADATALLTSDDVRALLAD